MWKHIKNLYDNITINCCNFVLGSEVNHSCGDLTRRGVPVDEYFIISVSFITGDMCLCDQLFFCFPALLSARQRHANDCYKPNPSVGSCQHVPLWEYGGVCLQIRWLAAMYWIINSRQPVRAGLSARRFGVRLTTSHCKSMFILKEHTWMG